MVAYHRASNKRHVTVTHTDVLRVRSYVFNKHVKTVDADDTPKSTINKQVGNTLSELAIHPSINTLYPMLDF